jgi:hypothetical protein
MLKGNELRIISACLYADTGGDILIIKESKLKPSIQINKEKIKAIVGITPGE